MIKVKYAVEVSNVTLDKEPDFYKIIINDISKKLGEEIQKNGYFKEEKNVKDGITHITLTGFSITNEELSKVNEMIKIIEENIPYGYKYVANNLKEIFSQKK